MIENKSVVQALIYARLIHDKEQEDYLMDIVNTTFTKGGIEYVEMLMKNLPSSFESMTDLIYQLVSSIVVMKLTATEPKQIERSKELFKMIREMKIQDHRKWD